MIKIKNGSIQNISCHIGRIDAIAYDGDTFSLLTPNKKGIVKLDNQLCPIETLSTCRRYQCLCYSEKDHCYWAMSAQCPCTLFKLDENFCEIKTIRLSNTKFRQPCAISYSPCNDVLTILYTNTIVYVDIYNKEYQCMSMGHNDIQAFDIMSIVHGHVLAYLQNHQYFIEVTCSDYDSPSCFGIPEGFGLEGMYLYKSCLLSKDCYEYEIHLILCDTRSHEQYILPLLITYCTQECDYQECDCQDCKPSCQTGIYEILHSIALEEAGLAHILNAEGEKIQKAVASNTTIEELLQVNESVSNTILKATILEGQLIAKLESILCFCKDQCDDESPCSSESCPCSQDE